MNADQITGEKIHILMRRRSINQEALSPVLGGIAQASVSRKILGKRSWTLDELLAVALFLDVPVTDLLPGNDYDPAPAGRGRNGDVRPKGLEPLTFWLGTHGATTNSGPFWTASRNTSLAALDRQFDTLGLHNRMNGSRS